MGNRSLVVVQPDGVSERLTFGPAGVHREAVKTPKRKRRKAEKAPAPVVSAFDPTDPGWATPPWPTSRVTSPSCGQPPVTVFTLRQKVEAAIDRLIELLDVIDGDVDLEAETDLGAAEDEGVRNGGIGVWSGAGCPVFDGG